MSRRAQAKAQARARASSPHSPAAGTRSPPFGEGDAAEPENCEMASRSIELVTPERRYTLRADSLRERDEWIAAIKRAHRSTLTSLRTMKLELETAPAPKPASPAAAATRPARPAGSASKPADDGEFVSGMSGERQKGVENTIGNFFGGGGR